MIVVYFVSAYSTLVALAYIFQRFLQYSPHRKNPVMPYAEVRVRTPDGMDLRAWFAPPRDGKEVIVLFHGNADNAEARVPKMRPLVEAGYGVYFCEWRGYAGNPGRPSEEGFYNDARGALHWLRGNGFRDWIFYGESIGSGVAVQMALEFKPKRMILEGAFSSAVDVAAEAHPFLPVRYMLKDRFDNMPKIASIGVPLLMMHGDKDLTVPYKLGQKLFAAAAEPKRFITVKGGGHVDLRREADILEWLS